MEKNPRSLLQEHVLSLGRPLPVYDIQAVGANFLCIVKAEGLEAKASSTNKQAAKSNAAQKLLEKLKTDRKRHETNPPLPITTTAVVPEINMISQLNELCMKNHIGLPDYRDGGCITTNRGYNFVIKCTLLNHETEGRGRKKKDAKLMAAIEMFNKVNETYSLSVDKKKKTIEEQSKDAMMMTLFKYLSPFKGTARSGTTGTASNAVKDNFNCLFETIKLMFTKENVHKEELQWCFGQLKITYRIIMLQENPFILALKTDASKDFPSHTFVGSGATCEEAELSVLKAAIEHICILLK